MAYWKLEIEDYGKIKSAEIEVAPLTLFVGDNNSGKSYLLSLLWGIENLGMEAILGSQYVESAEVDSLFAWLMNQIDQAMKRGEHVVSVEEISGLLDTILNAELKKNKNNLVKTIFNSEKITIGHLAIRLGNLKETKLHFRAYKSAGIFELFDDDGNQRYGFSESILHDARMSQEKFIIWILIQAIYSCIMNIRIRDIETNGCIYLPAARTGFMLTKDIINKVGRKNTFNISSDKETITPFVRPINQFLDIMGELSAEHINKNNSIRLVNDLEEEMTNGTVEISAMPNKEVQYVPSGYKKGIPIRLASAVVTELSPLILILKHKAGIKRFYYEEP